MKTSLILILFTFFICLACSRNDSTKEMVNLIEQVRNAGEDPANMFSSTANLRLLDSLLARPGASNQDVMSHLFFKGNVLVELGREDEAIEVYNRILTMASPAQLKTINAKLAMAYLRKAERVNCIIGHGAESCLIPIRGVGLHQDTLGSSKAVENFLTILKVAPNDLESKWLLNLAYMTLGKYPHAVPPQYLIPGMEGDTLVKVNAFQDIALEVGLGITNMAGGTIVDDFNNDGYLDLVNSSMDLEEQMHFFKNNGDGTFTELSKESGLSKFHGGLNMVQADYDNDGDKDILVLRGAWKGEFGREPNSLLQNQGDGTFIDVTLSSGLLSHHPTQAATWSDFNNDGWLDIFIGNEGTTTHPHRSELYISNGDGTFTELGAKADCDVSFFVKGVTSGDYDNDGWSDIFISTMSGKRLLLKNLGGKGHEVRFQDVTKEAGLSQEQGRSFPTWFWDYNNDGWLDIFVCDYTFKESLAYYAAAEKLNIAAGNPEKAMLYRNNRNGTFTNVAVEMGLNKVIFAMGANFGDIDNDGYLDMYLGSGNPAFQSLVPNKMFKNLGGEKFADVTASARVGHLQKGHGVAFADMDNDGDEDIYIDMGGAYRGDAYHNSFFVNPGQGTNNWLRLELKGVDSNKDAIGTRIRITINENGKQRQIFRDVNSGGSFGSSPLRREIGIGQASIIEEIEIRWHGSGLVQRFQSIPGNQFIQITEGNEKIKTLDFKRVQWKLNDPLCGPTFLSTN